MQRGALITVLSLVLVGALALGAQSTAFAAQTLVCNDICGALFPGVPEDNRDYQACEATCEKFINNPPQQCNAICTQLTYPPGSKDHGECASICAEVTNQGKTDSVALCKILQAVGRLEETGLCWLMCGVHSSTLREAGAPEACS
jgi:hypothetical protein